MRYLLPSHEAPSPSSLRDAPSSVAGTRHLLPVGAKGARAMTCLCRRTLRKSLLFFPRLPGGGARPVPSPIAGRTGKGGGARGFIAPSQSSASRGLATAARGPDPGWLDIAPLVLAGGLERRGRALDGPDPRASGRGERGRRPPGRNADRKSVILLWLSGGPSHLDTWDPKPDAPSEVRGPYGTIATTVPGVRFCEHLPRQAAIMDKLTVIRSVDCSASNHTPITMQAGNPLARRTDNGRDGGGYPSMGSIAAKFRGPNGPVIAGVRGPGR